MIDTHAHILPGLDDGPDTDAAAVRIAKTALSQGVTTLFATPHTCDGVYGVTKEDIIKGCFDLTRNLEKKGMLLRILPGAEIRINHDLIQQFDAGRLMTLNNAGTHILLELPAMFMIKGIGLMIRQLCKRGVTPIIVHPERNPMILNWPGLVKDLVYQGAAMQITAASLTGDFGKQAMKVARDMVIMRQVFCLGSDMHPGRQYRMAKARDRLVKLAGQTAADRITHENASSLLNTRPLPDEMNTAQTDPHHLG